jgi:hypothetical protein
VLHKSDKLNKKKSRANGSNKKLKASSSKKNSDKNSNERSKMHSNDGSQAFNSDEMTDPTSINYVKSSKHFFMLSFLRFESFSIVTIKFV